MNVNTRERIRGGLNHHIENCGLFISAFNLRAYGNHDFLTIKESLEEWETRGLLKILKSYAECKEDDFCVKMLNFIDCETPHDRFWENPHLIRQMNEE